MDRPEKDEEYFFSEAEVPSQGAFAPGAPEPPRRPHLFEQIKRWHILVAIGGLIVLLGTYKIVSFLAGRATQKQAQTASAPPVVSSPAPSAKAKVAAPAAASTGVANNRIVAMEAQMADIDKKMAQEQEAITRIEGALSNMQSEMANLTSVLQGITTQLAEQQMRAAAAQREAEAKKKAAAARQHKRVVKRRIFYLKAVVPGRAWLQAADGTTTTIGLGQTLSGYGHVVEIDAAQGFVLTSSGEVIRFNSDDR